MKTVLDRLEKRDQSLCRAGRHFAARKPPQPRLQTGHGAEKRCLFFLPAAARAEDREYYTVDWFGVLDETWTKPSNEQLLEALGEIQEPWAFPE